MFNTNEFFTPGKLSILLDGAAGSSGKGKMGSFVCQYADNWQFCCNTFAPQAGHHVYHNGEHFFYQTLNSCAYQDKYEKMYIGPGGMIELPAFFREMEENNVKPDRMGIDPLVSILQDKDAAYERGEVDLDGEPKRSEGTMKKGSTCHGVGACRARKILRRPDVLLAKDVPELKEFICDVPNEVMERLDKGQAGFLEIAQGFQLSYLSRFYPYCTSRNVTVTAGLDDMMLPPIYAGNVLINMRAFPIRICNFKYIDPETGKHLIWDEVVDYEDQGRPYQKYEGSSGPGYNDQEEITWEQVTQDSGSPEPIIEMTSVTKLPRRVFTFSTQNLGDAIKHNATSEWTLISVNFMNYVDHKLFGQKGGYLDRRTEARSDDDLQLGEKAEAWLQKYVCPAIESAKHSVTLKYLGTGPMTDEVIVL